MLKKLLNIQTWLLFALAKNKNTHTSYCEELLSSLSMDYFKDDADFGKLKVEILNLHNLYYPNEASSLKCFYGIINCFSKIKTVCNHKVLSPNLWKLIYLVTMFLAATATCKRVCSLNRLIKK